MGAAARVVTVVAAGLAATAQVVVIETMQYLESAATRRAVSGRRVVVHSGDDKAEATAWRASTAVCVR